MSPGGTGAGPAVPAIIAGFPTLVEAFEVAGTPIALVTVRDLEQHVDRELLLHDESTVPPYWALVWGGARALAEHLVTRVECKGRSVLDVGCGLGLVALAASLRGALVTAIDRELAPIEFLQASAAINRVEVEVLVGDVVTASLERTFDLVLAADLLYERAEFDHLAEALSGLVAPDGTLWVADPQRVDTARFYAALERCGLSIREVGACELREENGVLRVRLIALGRG
ncbi:MAG: methyltransferase [Deltaproteobacteria bacterium]|nr:methyltransferase [Deltaproteobacteria bacterium]